MVLEFDFRLKIARERIGMLARQGSVFRILLWIAVLPLHTVAGAQTWQEGPGYRSAPLTVPPDGRVGFTLRLPQAGAIITANLPPSAKEVVVDLNGGVRQTR